MKTYKQLTLRQRYQIWTGVRLGLKHREIAAEAGVHRSSISRELRRNGTQEGYNPLRAERSAHKRRREKGRRRITEEVWEQIDERLRENWSPEQISGRRRAGNIR
jgi:IS30 family transposase